MVARLITVLLVSALPTFIRAEYTLAQDYTGPNFYNGFSFDTLPDPTNGHVVFVNEETANSTSLAGIIYGGNSTGAVYLGSDSTNLAPQGRSALRVTSTRTYNHGLFIADIGHMPSGCGTWPAFWLLGTSSDWPKAGEIDILEGVNDQTFNRMTLHTDAGAVVANTSTDFTGTMVTSNCDVNAPNQDRNAGCQIADQPTLPSFGAALNANGGGVFATEWTASAIKIWFFPRGAIPSDITSGQPNPSSFNSTWGTPNALFAGNFTIDDHFCELQIIFDTTFCGDWAGRVWNSSETCAPLADTCEDFVSNHPDAFKEAYWAINSLQVFEDDADTGNTTEVDVTRRLKSKRGGLVRRWL